jgi:hypothetical protein
MTTDYRALCAELVNELRLYKLAHPNHDTSLIGRAFALLNPHTESAATNLAARPLLEKVARMGDHIGQHTVGEIIAISNQAEAWLNGNPPGQPVAIEPRGCPTPGACSCVEPEAQPEPVAPTLKEVSDWILLEKKKGARWATATDHHEALPIACAAMHHALARWGTPANNTGGTH